MKTFDVKGVERKEVGKKSTKALRVNEQVPCVLYGGEKVVHFAVESKALKKLVYTPNVYIVNLDIDGTKYNAIMQDLQFHPVTDAIEHIDFYQVVDDKPVSIAVPVKLNGLAAGVTQGGKLNLKQRTLKVRALHTNLPDVLDVDVTELTLGKSIKVSEVSFENLEILENKNSVIATVRLTRSAMSAAAEGEEGEEGAEAPAAEEAAE